MPSLSAASAPENVPPFGPFVLRTARGNTTNPLWLLFGSSLTRCCCTLASTLNNECAIKHAEDTEITYFLEFSSPSLFLSAGVRRPVSLSVKACHVCVGHVFRGEQDPCFSCGQLTRLGKGRASLSLGSGKYGVGAQSTVAHKRISPPHKDSGPLLSLTRPTKRVTFVCLGVQEGVCHNCPGWGRRRRTR